MRSRILFTALAAAGLLTMALAIAWLYRKSLMTERMLRARAEVQVMDARATAEGRPFTPAEKRRFNELCEVAQYDAVPGGCEELK